VTRAFVYGGDPESVFERQRNTTLCLSRRHRGRHCSWQVRRSGSSGFRPDPFGVLDEWMEHGATGGRRSPTTPAAGSTWNSVVVNVWVDTSPASAYARGGKVVAVEHVNTGSGGAGAAPASLSECSWRASLPIPQVTHLTLSLRSFGHGGLQARGPRSARRGQRHRARVPPRLAPAVRDLARPSARSRGGAAAVATGRGSDRTR
jgi:hypothetical protein